MSGASSFLTDQETGHVDRETVCLADISQDTVLHVGDVGFSEALHQHFITPENNASEQLVALKARLRLASTLDFWTIVLEGICEIAGAQSGFVSKRILVEDQNTAVEMPPLGEPGSCLMGIGFYLVPEEGSPQMYHDYQYLAYGTPCAYMKHDKVFIIPERMSEFIRENPNKFPFQCEAYIGIPLFFEGKCFAHFGMLWSSEGARRRNLSWGFIEMLLHSLEDMIFQRILEGKGFAKESISEDRAKIIPIEAITASQSLKPYARSLSHELRTPMQGVVGMLDIMYSTVVGSIACEPHEHLKAVFQELKENIEQAQDSSRRAVEAADAVVHACDLDMQMPDTPLPSPDGMSATEFSKNEVQDTRPEILIEGPRNSSSPKRKLGDDGGFNDSRPLKKLAHRDQKARFRRRDDNMIKGHVADNSKWPGSLHTNRDSLSEMEGSSARSCVEGNSPKSPANDLIPTHRHLIPTHRHINIRQFFSTLLNPFVKYGLAERTIYDPNDLEDIIEAITQNSKSGAMDKIMRLTIDSKVPKTIITDDTVFDLAVQKVIENALKFSDSGTIGITVSISQTFPVLEIRISDQGRGITREAQANLFKPFSQQDGSLSRQKEGLGMGLYIAKARIRQSLCGDIILERSETDGPNKGSQFLIRIPISTSENDGLESSQIPGTYFEQPTFRDTILAPEQLLINPETRIDSLAIKSAPTTPISHSPLAQPPKPQLKRPRSFASSIATTRTNNPSYNPDLSQSYPLTFLIAEDNALNRKLLLKCLQSLGYSTEKDVLVAVDGLEAVELFERGKRKIDVILMDLWMPGLDGYQAALRIFEICRSRKRDDNEFGISGFDEPVIMAVTADITTESRRRAEEVGMKGFMSKPYRVVDVQNLIMEFFPPRGSS